MKELPERIHDDTNGLDYVLVGDYYIPALRLTEESLISSMLFAFAVANHFRHFNNPVTFIPSLPGNKKASAISTAESKCFKSPYLRPLLQDFP
ncbi:hypothetical protein IMSAGC019_01304 [Lachnospiraceae bacterium]|nr:hypothetical protein IMSAGC019_01304 [Lachnospiraceae bacterium]